MISFNDDLDIDVSDESSISDFVTKASKHHWKVGFKFQSGNRNPTYNTNGKKYGSNKTFEQIYAEFKKKDQDFIDRYFDDVYPYSDVKELGDGFLSDINDEVGIIVDSIITAKDEVFSINKNIKINYTRKTNAGDRLNTQREIVDSLREEIYYLESNLKKTKRGTYDRRTSGYGQYTRALRELDIVLSDLYRYRANYERELSRYENSLDRKEEAIRNLNRIKDGRWDTINQKYENVAKEFAERIKDDIVSKARTGELPLQNLGLSEATIKKRLSVGLPTQPRFWATTQLVNSIIVTCTLV